MSAFRESNVHSDNTSAPLSAATVKSELSEMSGAYQQHYITHQQQHSTVDPMPQYQHYSCTSGAPTGASVHDATGQSANLSASLSSSTSLSANTSSIASSRTQAAPYPQSYQLAPTQTANEVLINGKRYQAVGDGYVPVVTGGGTTNAEMLAMSQPENYGIRASFGSGNQYQSPTMHSPQSSTRSFEATPDSSINTTYRHSLGEDPHVFPTQHHESALYSQSVLNSTLPGHPAPMYTINGPGPVSVSDQSRKRVCTRRQSHETARLSEIDPETGGSLAGSTSRPPSVSSSPPPKSVHSQPRSPSGTASPSVNLSERLSERKQSESGSGSQRNSVDESSLRTFFKQSPGSPTHTDNGASESVTASASAHNISTESADTNPEPESHSAPSDSLLSSESTTGEVVSQSQSSPSSIHSPLSARGEILNSPSTDPNFRHPFPTSTYYRSGMPIPVGDHQQQQYVSAAAGSLARDRDPSGVSFARPCIPGGSLNHPSPQPEFYLPAGSMIQTNGTFVPPVQIQTPNRLHPHMNMSISPQSLSPFMQSPQLSQISPGPRMIAPGANIAPGAVPHLHQATAHNQLGLGLQDPSTLNPIIPPKVRGVAHQKRDWHNVGWFTDDAAMNIVRKQQKVSKWKSVEQISGLKVFFRCNKWKRTSCNYRMYTMYFAPDKISLNESGEHDHSSLHGAGRSRGADTPPPASARAVFEATPSSSQQRVLDQLIMNATSMASTSAYEGENVFETSNASTEGSCRPKSETPSHGYADSEDNGPESSYQLSDGQNIAELLQVAADMDLTFTFNSRRTCEYCFESNTPEMKGRMIVFSDLGNKVAVAERDNGVERGCEQWKKADWKQFLWAVRGKCMNALKGV